MQNITHVLTTYTTCGGLNYGYYRTVYGVEICKY